MSGQERGLTVSGAGEEPNFEYSANQRELSLDLYRFGCEAWKLIEGTDHVPSRHQQVLCDHLTHVRSKRIMRMLLNIPPSCGKSTWICAIFPAWVWTRFPGYNLTLYSNHPKLVKRDMTKCRDLLRSKWYQYNFPDVRVRRGHDQKYEFGLTEGGGYTGTTPGSSISTGTHPDILLFEDPQTREQAESLVEREALNDWFFETMGSRGIGKDAAQVVSQQRFQLKDLSGAIIEKYEQELKEDGYTEWVHLSMAMRYRAALDKGPTPYGGDWRTQEGELLFPEFMNDLRVKRLERVLSRRSMWAVETQLQQNVTTKDGVMFKIARLQVVNEFNPLPLKFDRVVRAWDRAATTREENANACYTAGVLIGVKGTKYYILDVRRGQWDWTQVEDEMVRAMHEDVARYGYDVVVTVFEREPSASGKQVAEMFVKKHRAHRVGWYQPDSKKGVRAQPLASAIKDYDVYIVAGDWYLDFVEELRMFNPQTDGGFKDQVDAAGLAFNELVNPSKNMLVFHTPELESNEATEEREYGGSRPCRTASCRRPAFKDEETGGYCCQCCADADKLGNEHSHSMRCNGEYSDWFARMRG